MITVHTDDHRRRESQTELYGGKLVRPFECPERAGTLRAELYAQGRSIPLGANQTSTAFGCVHVRSNVPRGKAFSRRCSGVAIYLC